MYILQYMQPYPQKKNMPTFTSRHANVKPIKPVVKPYKIDSTTIERNQLLEMFYD